MSSKIAPLFILLTMLSSAILAAQLTVPVEGAPGIIEVPGDYATIQAAINAAKPGDTVLVHAGTYNETLTINKYLRLVGEDKHTTIINSDGTGDVIYVTADGVYISGFTIRNGGYFRGIYLRQTYGSVVEGNILEYNLVGIYLHVSRFNYIINNLITNNNYGVALYFSSSNVINNNTITLTYVYGIRLYGGSTQNSIYGNTISNNLYPTSRGIYIDDDDHDNIIYHNSFIDNTIQVSALDQRNAWDKGAEGNFWSDYVVEDLNGDAIGDDPYIIDSKSQDNYPLVSPYWYWGDPIPGDVNKNREVGDEDLYLLAAAYGSTPTKPNWNPNADFNDNGAVESKDLIFELAPNYGQSC